MSTSGPMRAGAAGVSAGAAGVSAGAAIASAGRPGFSYIYVAGSPRRARKRRRAVLLFVVSLAVLMPIGLQIHRTMADHTTAVGPPASGSAVPRQQVAEPAIDDATTRSRPEPGAIDPALSRALGKAQAAALTAGLDLEVTSGFRGVATQQRLYDQAVSKYGTAERARRWVLPPAESAHVNGLAIDVGPRAAAAWLEKHGVRYGLCRRYVNEWWHFERLAPAIGQQCPSLEPFAGG